jgi:hypothetical protein
MLHVHDFDHVQIDRTIVDRDRQYGVNHTLHKCANVCTRILTSVTWSANFSLSFVRNAVRARSMRIARSNVTL